MYQEPSIVTGKRERALGYIGNRRRRGCLCQATNIRVISLRKAHPKEESRYAAS